MLSNFYHRVLRLLHFTARCVVDELPLFILTIVLWGTESLRNYEGVLQWDADTSVWEYVSRFSMTLAAAFFFTLLLRGSRFRCLRRIIIYALVLLSTFLIYFIREHTGMELCATAWQMVLETNEAEATSFFQVYIWNAHAWLTIGSFLFLTFVVILCDRWYHRHKLKPLFAWLHSRWLTCVTNAFLLLGVYCASIYIWRLSAVLMESNPQHWEAYYKTPAPHDPLSKFALSLYSLRGMRAEIQQAVNHTQSFVNQDKPTVNTDSLHVVLVVGESYIRSHAGIYGYPLPTTPSLSRELKGKQLVVFRDAITPVATTFQAMHEIFFAVSDSDERWSDGVFFPAVMRRAGYHVTYLDNQTVMETGATRSGQGYTVLNPMFHPDMIRLAYDSIGERNYDYDGQLLDAFLQRPPTKKLSFTILHLKGQHFDAKKMFPEETAYQVFQPTDYTFRNEPWLNQTMLQHIADYDNATLYNDRALAKLFDYYRDKRAVIVYLSDHGEEVYDYRNQWGRQHRETDVRQIELLYRVPLVVWCSDSYRNTFPNVMKSLSQGATLPFITNDLPQLVLSLAQVQSSLSNPHRSPASETYCPKPRVLLDGRNFDEIVGK